MTVGSLAEQAAVLDDDRLIELIAKRLGVDERLDALVNELALRYHARRVGIETARGHVQLCADFIATLAAPTVTGLLDPDASEAT